MVARMRAPSAKYLTADIGRDVGFQPHGGHLRINANEQRLSGITNGIASPPTGGADKPATALADE